WSAFHLLLLSFPTRRSSDLPRRAAGLRAGEPRALHAHHALDAVARRGVRALAGHGDRLGGVARRGSRRGAPHLALEAAARPAGGDRKSTRLNSSHVKISYAV